MANFGRRKPSLLPNLDGKSALSYNYNLARVGVSEGLAELAGGSFRAWRYLQIFYLFPQNYEFYKDDVIHLWDCASSFHRSNETKFVFEDFELLHFFQISCVDDSTGHSRYKLSNSFLNLVEKHHDTSYFRIIESAESSIPDNIRHVSVQGCIDSVILRNLYKAKELHTLIMFPEHGAQVNSIPHEFFLRLQCIRVLDMSHTNIAELPSSIGTLQYLIYLNLSWTPITALPNSICNLYKMEILKLRGCLKLTSLPKGMRKLIRLRCLDVDVDSVLFSMPHGFGDLRNLQTLPAFAVSRESGSQITELKHLVNLRGTLRILKLENVLSSEEAEETDLDKKEFLEKLELHWTETLDGFDILENLRPHQDLNELQIVGYGGTQFPSWIGEPLFCSLTSITIHGCINCELLPPLGKLSSLKFLFISDMDGVEIIDRQFCGMENVKAFPRLESFTLNGAANLEKWNGTEDGDFPCLEKLNISDCSKLTTLPYLSLLRSLQQIEISHCPILESFLDGELPVSLHSLVIIYCPLLKEQYYEDEAQNGRGLAHIANIWIDYQRISKAQPPSESGTSLMSFVSNPHDVPTEVQDETLTRKIQPQEVEQEKTSKQQKEAISIAGEETAKCKEAKEVNKSRTTQPKDMAERLPVVVEGNINRKTASYASFGSSPASSGFTVNVLDLNESNNVVLSSDAVPTSINSIPNHSNNIVGHPEPPTHQEAEWVEQDEPGVYITLTALPGGVKGLKRVRFSRKRFSEKQAEQWWAENRTRVYELYNVYEATSSSDESNNVVLSSDAVPTAINSITTRSTNIVGHPEPPTHQEAEWVAR